MKPGSWCENPLWSCRQTVDDSRMFSDATGARHGTWFFADVQPLRVLVEHRVDDVREGLVGVEEAVPAGEQVALEPAEQRVLGEHLHHAAVARQLAAVGVLRQQVGHPGLLARLVDRLQPVRGGLVRAEDAEARHVVAHDVAQELAERPACSRAATCRAPGPSTA